jgi:NarL family two-component system sensor histidine kinase LiaS
MTYLQNIFGRLRWKLTLSYTLVTVATLLVLELCLITGFSYLVINSNILPSALISAVDFFIIPQVADFLDQPQPDVESLTEWLEVAFTEGITFRSSRNSNVSFHLGDLDQSSSLVVLDQNLVWLAGMPNPNEQGTKVISDSSNEIISAARNGESDVGSLFRISDDLMTIAVPVKDDDGEVLAIILMAVAYPPKGSFPQIITFIGGSLIIFTLAAGLVGTFFGYFSARGPTKRLKNVSASADSWSQGDFSNFIQDQSADEIGQLAQKLNRMAEQLQNLLETKQELAALEERNRLARDLHDSVKQQVFASTMQIGAARSLLEQNSGSAGEHLAEAEKLSRQAQSELTELIRELRPLELTAKGLIPAFEEYVTDWSRQSQIAAEVFTQLEFSLPQEVEEALFRVTQEALSNISRHSKASKVEIRISGENDIVVLIIADNGIGFDISVDGGLGMGLHSMRERIEALGGEFSVDSEPGQGTRISATYKVTD